MSTTVELEKDDVSGSGTITIDCKGMQEVFQKITLTGNATIEVSNIAGTKTLVLVIVQDGTGGRTLAFSADFMRSSAAPSSGADELDAWVFVKGPTGTIFCEASLAKDLT